jgi:hypothetical protein
VNPDPASHKNRFVCSFVGPFIFRDRDSKNGSESTDPLRSGSESNLYKVSDTPKMISKGKNEFTGFLTEEQLMEQTSWASADDI